MHLQYLGDAAPHMQIDNADPDGRPVAVILALFLAAAALAVGVLYVLWRMQ